jgi:hypothetical protein
MKIVYENNIEDLVQFNLYHNLEHSEYIKKKVRRIRWGLSLMFLLGFSVIALFKESLEFVYYGLFAGVGYFFIFPVFFRNNIIKHVRRIYSKGKNLGVIGVHSLEIVDDGLISITSQVESKLKWESITPVIRTKEYAFIYISAASAYIIPLKSVKKGNLEEFLNLLATKTKK